MIVDIPFKEGDSEIFLAGLNGLVAHFASEVAPKEVYVKRINKWFDRKWLKYVGNGLIPFPQMEVQFLETDCESSKVSVQALDGQIQEGLALPPFNPREIGYPYYWPQGEDGTYDEGIDKPRLLQIPLFQYSSLHLQSRVASFTDTGLYVWFSSNTGKEGRGSIMTCLVKDGDTQVGYASLERQSGWKIEKVEGTNIGILEDWFQK